MLLLRPLNEIADSHEPCQKLKRMILNCWKNFPEIVLKDAPKIIECFDISHVSGTFVVASMVRFVNGKPYRKGYRRYKIKSFEGNDDFRVMEEVVFRRYGRLRRG